MMEFTPLPPDYQKGNAERELNSLGHSLEEPLWLFWEELGEELNSPEEMMRILMDWTFQIKIAEPHLSHASAYLAAKVFLFG